MKGYIKKLLRESLLKEAGVLKTPILKKDENFYNNLPSDVKELNNIFGKKYKLFVVGGAIRDHLQEKTPHDYDLATDATPDQIKSILSSYATVTDEGTEQGVSFVYFGEEKTLYEIGTFQTRDNDTGKPGAVKFSTIEKDAARRDLTINALYYDIDTHEIVDYVDGINHITQNKVKAVGTAADRFKDDNIRKLRAIRFTDKTGATLDDDIIQAFIDDNTLDNRAIGSRLKEFNKGVKSSRDVAKYLTTLDEYGFLGQIILNANIPNVSEFTKLKNTKYVIGVIAFLLSKTSFKGTKDLYNYLVSTLMIGEVDFNDDKTNGKQFANLIVFIYYAIRKDFPSMIKTIDRLDFVKEEIPNVSKFLEIFYPTQQIKHMLMFNKKKEKGLAYKEIQGTVKGKEIGEEIDKILLQKFSDFG